MRARIAGAAVAVTACAALAGCGGTEASHSAVPVMPRASVSALAAVPGADGRQVLVRAGVPVNGTSAQQLAFARSMAVKGNRQALAQRLAIPPAQRPAFEAALLDAVKRDHFLKAHANRVQFFDRDLPGLLARYA